MAAGAVEKRTINVVRMEQVVVDGVLATALRRGKSVGQRACSARRPVDRTGT